MTNVVQRGAIQTEQNRFEQLERKMARLYRSPLLPHDLVNVVDKICRLQLLAFDKISSKDFANSLPPVCSSQKHAMGMPLLPKNNFIYAEKSTQSLVDEILTCMSGLDEPLPTLIEGMRSHLNLHDYCRDLLSDRLESTAPLDGAFSPQFFLRFVVMSALAPSLFYVSSSLGKKLHSNGTWPYGHCPVCSSMPIMHYGFGEAEKVHAVCSFCHFKYPILRALCPACLKNDTTIKTLHSVEDIHDENEYFLMVCNDCQHYIKIARDMPHQAGYLSILDDLRSLPLDQLALEMKLSRVSQSPWSF